MPKEYRTIQEVAGPLMLVQGVENVTYDELGEIELASGEKRRCKVLEIDGGNALVQLFESSTGINLSNSKVRFLGRTMELGVSEDMLGRVFDGLGNPIDGGPEILPEERRDINGLPMNPAARSYPQEFIQTGVSAIDGLNTLVRGQKLPIFSASGLPHANLAAQIARQAKVRGKEAKELMVILGEAALSDVDLIYAKFADAFEKEYVSQGYNTDRDIEETLRIGWKLLSILPRSELKRIDEKYLDLYYGKE